MDLGSWIRAPIEISIGSIGFNRDPRFCQQTSGQIPRLKFQSVQSVSIGIQDSANRPLGRFPPLPKDLPNSMSVIALILVDLWGGGYHIYIHTYTSIYDDFSYWYHALHEQGQPWKPICSQPHKRSRSGCSSAGPELPRQLACPCCRGCRGCFVFAKPSVVLIDEPSV